MQMDRTKILEVYFERLHWPEVRDEAFADLYDMDIEALKNILLAQFPRDPLLEEVLRINELMSISEST